MIVSQTYLKNHDTLSILYQNESTEIIQQIIHQFSINSPEYNTLEININQTLALALVDYLIPRELAATVNIFRDAIQLKVNDSNDEFKEYLILNPPSIQSSIRLN